MLRGTRDALAPVLVCAPPMRKAPTHWTVLFLAVAPALWSCRDDRSEAELAQLRRRVADLEAPPAPGRVAFEHAHPRLTLTNFPGCRAEGGMKRVLVERALGGNCGLGLFVLEPDPSRPNSGPCPKDYDVVVRWWGFPGGPQEPERLEQRDQQVYEDGRVLVGNQVFDCPSPTHIQEVWITPPGLKID